MYGNIIQYDSATFDSSNEVIYVSVRSVSIKSVYSYSYMLIETGANLSLSIQLVQCTFDPLGLGMRFWRHVYGDKHFKIITPLFLIVL